MALTRKLDEYLDDERVEYFKAINGILSCQVPKDDPEKIKEHLTVIIGHRSTIATILAKLEMFLDEALSYYLPQKEKSDTDLDRKLKLDSNVSQFRYWRNLVEGYLKTIDIQVSSMQSLLSYEKKHLTQLEGTT